MTEETSLQTLHIPEAATGKAQSLMVERRVGRTTSDDDKVVKVEWRH